MNKQGSGMFANFAARCCLFTSPLHVQGTGRMWGLMVASQAAVVAAMGNASATRAAGESRAMLLPVGKLLLERERTHLQRQLGGMMRWVYMIAPKIHRFVMACIKQLCRSTICSVMCAHYRASMSICRHLYLGFTCLTNALLVQRQAWQGQVRPGIICSKQAVQAACDATLDAALMTSALGHMSLHHELP